ncbi:MAG: Slp family lipoprotein [Leptospirales bacterium]
MRTQRLKLFQKGLFPLLLIPALFLSACAGGTPFPSSQIQSTDHSVRISRLVEYPGDYVGKTVILGGIINMVERNGIINRIYVQTYPLGKNYHPDLHRPPKGHIMIVTDQPLRPALYAPGRTIEVIGVVRPPQEMPNLAGQQEKIPVIRARHLHVQSLPPPPSSGMGLGFGFMPVMGF